MRNVSAPPRAGDEPEMPSDVRRDRVRAMQPALRMHANIPVVLGGDWHSSVHGDGRLDLRADSVMPHIDAMGGDVICEEMAD